MFYEKSSLLAFESGPQMIGLRPVYTLGTFYRLTKKSGTDERTDGLTYETDMQPRPPFWTLR